MDIILKLEWEKTNKQTRQHNAYFIAQNSKYSSSVQSKLRQQYKKKKANHYKNPLTINSKR